MSQMTPPLLPTGDDPLVLRTDFSDAAAWEEIRRVIRLPVGPYGFLANVEFVDDARYDGLALNDVPALAPDHSFIMIADTVSMLEKDHPLLIVDLFDPPMRTFRAVPGAIQAISNNLSLANMDFEDFADAADPDGIFREFTD